MRVLATLLVIALLVGWVADHGQAAGSLGASVAELLQPLVQTVRELFAWPSPQPGRVEPDKPPIKVVQLPPVEKAEVVELPPVELPPKVVELPPEVRQGWMTICSPGGAFYVPKEVFDAGAVCEDHSLGVPLREARHMSREELDARIEAIRQRYLAERGH